MDGRVKPAYDAAVYGSFNMETAESEIGLGKWYEQLRYGEFARSPSCVRMRKLLGVAGWAKKEATPASMRRHSPHHNGMDEAVPASPTA